MNEERLTHLQNATAQPSHKAPYVLEAFGLQVTYGPNQVLHVPHFTLEEGERFVLIGPNGAGKTTLLRVLATLQPPARGQITYRGTPLHWGQAHLYRRRVAVVLHPPPLLDLSVYHNVALGLYLRGMRGQRVHERVTYWLRRFHVEHLASRRALHLSRGEVQRVALARAFVLEPDILFLDEPFSGLDEPTRARLVPDLRQSLEDTGTTTLLITHNREDALALGDRVAVMMEGRICQVGTPEEIFTYPASVAVARFVGVENLLPARVTRVASFTHVHCLPDGPELLSTSKGNAHAVTVCIRPEYIRWARDPATRHLVGTTFPAQVAQAFPLGSRVRLHLQCGRVTFIAVWDYVHWQACDVNVGATLPLFIAAKHVHLLPAEGETDTSCL